MERTGIIYIDRLIEQYLRENPDFMDEDISQPDDPRWEAFSRGRLSDMRYRKGTHRQASQTLCGQVADHFTGWMIDRGVMAYMSDDSEAENNWSWHGYSDRPEAGDPADDTHCATLLEAGGRTYMIDWTASQYGYQEFPMVQRAGTEYGGQYDSSRPQPTWERDWSLQMAGQEGATVYAALSEPQAAQAETNGLAPQSVLYASLSDAQAASGTVMEVNAAGIDLRPKTDLDDETRTQLRSNEPISAERLRPMALPLASLDAAPSAATALPGQSPGVSL